MSAFETHPWLATSFASVARRLQAGQLPHALLLCGPVGLGKHALAREIAMAAMCGARGDTGAGCGTCPSCRHFSAGSHADFRHVTLEINPRTDKLRTRIGVDQIRDLAQAMSLTLSAGRCRVAIIEPAELMNTASANALLKTLEEPPAHTLIMLVTARPDRLPITVLSRCQRLEVAMPDADTAGNWLESQGIVSEQDRRLARIAGGGSPGLALEIARSGQLKQVATLVQQLEGIYGGRIDPLAAADAWEDDELPQLLVWMNQISADLIRCAMSHSDDPGWGERLLDLTRSANLPSLFEVRDAIHTAAYEAEGSIRRDLLRDDVFLAWGRSAAASKANTDQLRGNHS